MLPLLSIANSSLRLSSMCLGSSAFNAPEAQMDRLYAAFREAGGNCFDSAHCYWFWLPAGKGGAERALGQCIRRHGDSGQVRILTKGGHPSMPPDYPRPDAYLSPEVIASDIADSLEWLGEPIDLYLLHRDDARVPVSEIVDALNAHISAGHVRAIGASNWSTPRLSQANAHAAGKRLHGFVASQPQFNLGHPNARVPAEDPAMRYLTPADLAWHRQSGLAVICYAPTASGYFASAGQRAAKTYDNDISRARLERAADLANRLGVSSGQIALAYLRCQSFPVIPILGTADLEHLKEAMGAEKIALTAEQVEWLENGTGTLN